MVFSGTNATATITGTDLSAGGTKTQVFTGFETVTVDPPTIAFQTGTIDIGTLNILDNSTLFVRGNVVLTGTANVVGSTITMINGSVGDVFSLGGLALNGATLGIDISQQALQADQMPPNISASTTATG